MAIGGSSFFWVAKRLFDILVSLAMMPLFCLAALFLLIVNPKFNPGPLIFFQHRVGLRNTPFRIYKFRTMVGASADPKFATAEKARILPLGNFLRAKRIDELPQIINILKGEMSFVGPRPEQPTFWEEYNAAIKNYSDRHVIRPGISGLAQVEIGYTSDKKGAVGKLKYDLRYIQNSGFKMEFYVIRRTIVTIATGFGAE